VSVTNWARLFDFGSGSTANMFLAPRSGFRLYGRVLTAADVADLHATGQ
jgi:hypothetical protein